MRYRRRRYLTPKQKRQYERIGRANIDAQIIELGVSKTLERIWEPYEVAECIQQLQQAYSIRQEIEKMESPRRRPKK